MNKVMRQNFINKIEMNLKIQTRQRNKETSQMLRSCSEYSKKNHEQN